MSHPYPPPGPDAVLAEVERQGVQLAAAYLAGRWRDMTTTEGECQAESLGLGLCESCELETITIAFLTGLANGEAPHA